MHFDSHVVEITETTVTIEQNGETIQIQNDYVFAMTGYHPNHTLLKEMGIEIDEQSGCPLFNDKTMESSVKGLYIAGVIAAGNNANEIFIENGRFHGAQIANAIEKS
jgi:thioredoxin reductase (NADPH)